MSKLNRWKTVYVTLAFWAATISPAQTFTTLASFNGTNGRNPAAALVQGTDGNFYGTTVMGGTSAACTAGCGTVFRLTRNGTVTTVYSFDLTHGAYPYGALLLGTDGNLYGTTFDGGINSDGTVFKLTLDGKLKTLHSFSYYVDGANPLAGLVQATDGNFYGATFQGGANGDGTIFRITAEGELTTLHGFDCNDGANPAGALVQGTDGSLYGTTNYCGPSFYGTVFRLGADGALTTLLSFTDESNGGDPFAGPIQAPNGEFYGTAPVGGTNASGTVYRVTSTGVSATVYNFCTQSNCADGYYPYAGLTEATDGNLYGTTAYGGANFSSMCANSTCGTIFKIAPSGALTTLYSFCAQTNCTDGAVPFSGVVQGTDGRFYGAVGGGGVNGYGTVYALYAGLRPFVETVPITGQAETAVMILGTDLASATSVTFNGTPASFTVVSSTEITTTVPTAATTGKIQVVTPTATLSSNVEFRVRP